MPWWGILLIVLGSLLFGIPLLFIIMVVLFILILLIISCIIDITDFWEEKEDK